MNPHQRALEDYIEYWETLTPRSVRLIEKLGDPGMMFKDPFNNVQGLEAVETVLSKIFQDTEKPRFKVQNHAWAQDGKTAFLRWQMRFLSKGRKREWIIDGMSEIYFSDSGKVMAHYDHWDSGSQLFSRLPVCGFLFNLVKKRLGA